MKQILPTPYKIPPKVNKLADRVMRSNLEVYDGKYD